MSKSNIFFRIVAFFAVSISFVCFFTSCKMNSTNEADLPSDAITKEVDCKVLFVSLPENFRDESNMLSDDAKDLFSGLVGVEGKCNFGYVLKPILVRVDIDAILSIATKFEKSGIAKRTPIRDFKLVKQHLDEVTLSDKLLSTLNPKSDSLFNGYITSKIDGDSIVVFSNRKGVDSVTINGKWYNTFSDVTAIRTKMQSILCSNSDASITLLINPPMPLVVTRLTLKVEPNCETKKITIKPTGGDGSPIIYSAKGLSTGQSSNVFTFSKNQLNGVTFTFVARQGTGSSTVKHLMNCPVVPHPAVGQKLPTVRGQRMDNGDLTKIKDTEGCDVCTRYYAVTDNIGRQREVREKNSTFCCPCGKTIEIRGRTYRMECDGAGNNRLALVTE